MTLSLLHASIAMAGLAAVAVPILLHLMLRERPKTIIFPALRLLQKNQRRLVRRLQIRHWLLLLLRALLVALLGLALARPTLRSSLLTIDQEAPIAVGIVVDNSFSMQFREKGETRLDAAKAMAQGILRNLPDGSRVWLAEVSTKGPPVPLEPAAAARRLKEVDFDASPRPLNEAIGKTLEGLLESDLERREIYVLTDHAAHAWRLEPLREHDSAGASEIPIFLLDFEASNKANVALGVPRFSARDVVAGGSLEIQVPVRNHGPPTQRTLTLTLDGQVRDQRVVDLPGNQDLDVTFTLQRLSEGYHAGQVAAGADELPFDDVRFFSIIVPPPSRVLVVRDRPADPADPGDAFFWTNAIEPEVLRRADRGRFQIEEIDTKRLLEVTLQGYDSVHLINVSSLSNEAWEALARFANAGGGVFVALGERVIASNYNSAAAQAILPARLLSDDSPSEATYFSPDRFSHPILAPFEALGGAGDLLERPVLRYWRIERDPNVSATVASFANGDPALVERAFGGGGSCLLWTTAAHYRPGSNYWTEIPLGWGFVVLAEQVTRHLTGAQEHRLLFAPGASPSIPVDPNLTLFTVTAPDGEVTRLAGTGQRSLLIPPSFQLGTYRVESADAELKFLMGFSINEPESESELVPIGEEQLRQILGDRVQIARDPESLAREVSQSRVGRELFPWIMLLVLLALLGETYLSARIYRRAPPPSSAALQSELG